jgi:hypothetical protein
MTAREVFAMPSSPEEEVVMQHPNLHPVDVR